jgi:hypothetical protein
LIVHSLDHARSALTAAQETGQFVVLDSPPSGALSLGAPVFLAIIEAAAKDAPGARFEAVLDCGDAPGAALGALRAGVPVIRLAASAPIFAKIADIARKMSARAESEPPAGEVLDLAGTEDPLAATRSFLAGIKDRS